MLRFILRSILFYIPFFLIGAGAIAGGFITDTAALTSDGFNLQYFLFMFGGFFVVFPAFLIGGIFLFSLAKQKRLRNIVETGKQGTAKVLRLEDTGVRINDNPRVNILLEMRIEGFQPYQAWKKVTVPMINLSQVQVGETIAVWADPHEPTNQKKIALGLK
jgi:hypothetical protein